MKKFIRYLYEYQNGKRVQNVGFVKVEQNEDGEVIQIYGKGFPTGEDRETEVFVFYMMGQIPVGISMGTMKGTKPMFGYRLAFSPEDVGGREIFEEIDGMIWLDDTSGLKRWYAAVWDERAVPVEQMLRREEVLRREPPAEAEQPEEAMTEEAVAEETAEETSAEETASEEVTVEEAAAEEADVEEAAAEAAEETSPPPLCSIYKIAREDLAQLPRREWRLANNNFLLHGYYNYHHLVSFEKDGDCWLGVPGIYHPKEQKAADAFGFGQFMKPDEGEIQLAEDEMSAGEDFGYWCRKVGAVVEK